MPIIRGTIVAWDSTTYLASVRLDGSSFSILTALPTNRAIPSSEMLPNRRVLIDAPPDASTAYIVIAVYE